MMIRVFNFKRYRVYILAFLAAVILLAALGIFSPKTASVFSDSRKIPIYSVETNEKKASITFDCAWGADDIPQILEILRNENVKASFFIVGQWAEKYPDMVKSIAADGHDIANHSYSHLRMGALDRSRIISEISNCGRKLEELTGRKVDLFRPPYGDYSNNVVSAAKDLGYYTIQWSVDSLDWKPELSGEEIVERVTGRIEPGSIILFHNDTRQTAKVLPDIISAIKKKGYSFVPVSNLIIREDYDIDYTGKQLKRK
jgi:polysaccharide deacetylase family sporulation protein PdaB